MSILQRIYTLQQSNNVDTLQNSSSTSTNCWDNASIENQREETNPTSTNDVYAAQSTNKMSSFVQAKVYIIGLVLGILAVGSALIIVVILWQQSKVTITSTTTVTTTTVTSTTTTSTTTTSTSTTSITSSITTTTAPPWSLCVINGVGQRLTNNTFLYSPTGQNYAAGMLNNQFGVYQAFGYGSVSSTALWTAQQVATSETSWLALQRDRNLVVYSTVPVNGTIVMWTPQIENNGTGSPFCLQMLDTGNLVWINSTSDIIWESNSTVVARG